MADPIPFAPVRLSEAEADGVRRWTHEISLATQSRPFLVFVGLCPWCGVDARPAPWSPKRVFIGAPQAPQAPQAPEAAGQQQPPTWKTEVVTYYCECVEAHGGRPPELMTGCGAAWNVRFEWRLGDEFDVRNIGPGPRPSAADVGFAKRWSDLKLKELESARTQADNWSKVMGGLTALIGATQILGGRDLVKGVEEGWQDAVGWFLLVAVLAGAAAAICAGVAAHGLPERVELTDTGAAGGEAAALDQRIDELVEKTSGWLVAAFVSTVVVVVATLVVGYGIWFQQREATAATAMCIQAEGGGTVEVAELPVFSDGQVTLIPCPA